MIKVNYSLHLLNFKEDEINYLTHSSYSMFQISQSQNRVYLNAGTLMLNINEKDYDSFIGSLKPKKWAATLAEKWTSGLAKINNRCIHFYRFFQGVCYFISLSTNATLSKCVIVNLADSRINKLVFSCFKSSGFSFVNE